MCPSFAIIDIFMFLINVQLIYWDVFNIISKDVEKKDLVHCDSCWAVAKIYYILQLIKIQYGINYILSKQKENLISDHFCSPFWHLANQKKWKCNTCAVVVKISMDDNFMICELIKKKTQIFF